MNTIINGNAVVYNQGKEITAAEPKPWENCLVIDETADKTEEGKTKGTIYGDSFTFSEVGSAFEIRDMDEITVETGTTVTIPEGVTLTNNGTIQINAGGTLTNNGALVSNGTLTNNGDLDGTGTVQYSVTYLDCDENGQHWEKNIMATEITDGLTTWGEADKTTWYVANGGNATDPMPINRSVTVNGDVHLILADNYILTVRDGIQMQNGSSLTIYAQSTGESMGRLIANTIGGGYGGSNVTITINGGDVTANGGIGSSRGSDSTITINGGKVNATGDGIDMAAVNGSSITITGGDVTASGGIGNVYGSSSTITITGGTVTATSERGVGIGSKYGGDRFTADGNAFIIASSISDHNGKVNGGWRGVIFERDTGEVYGDSVTLTTNAEIPQNKVLTIENGKELIIGSGVTLTNNGTINNHGTFTNNGTLSGNKVMPTAGLFTFKAPSDLTYSGQGKTATVISTANGIGAITVHYINEQNTSMSQAPVDAGTYTVKINVAEGDNYLEVSALTAESWMFTIAKAANSITNLTCNNIVYGGTPNPSATAKFGTITYTYSQRQENGEFGDWKDWDDKNSKGMWYVKASVDGTDNYSAAEQTISFQVTAQQEETPNASIDYQSETLTNLAEGASYSITPDGGEAEAVTASDGGTITMQESWFGKTLSIVKSAQSTDYSDSAAQSLSIPIRPATPTTPLKLTKTADSITVTNTGDYSGCEFSVDGTTWNDTGAFTGLTVETTYSVSVRVKATDTAFASESKTVNVTTVAADGSTTVKPGESVTTGDGTTITNDGEKTTITNGGTTTTVTPPSGGDVTVGTDGGVTVPGGSKVQAGDNGSEITVGDQGGKVNEDGGVTVPEGGTVTVKDESGKVSTITLPEGGAVTLDPGGNVTLPGGATVEKDGETVTVPDGGGTYDPDSGKLTENNPVTPVNPGSSGGDSDDDTPPTYKPDVSKPS